ncbi:MAG: hypothetical protein KDC84_04055 [Crocinitomicaceae bacterium]|nr:hypothetical protein [Crocinitomicaceae bacterium]
MKKGILIGLVILVGFACEEKKEEKDNSKASEIKTEKPKKKEDVFTDLTEEGIKKKILSFLSKNEDHFLTDSCFRIYRGQMNHDKIEDWVVAVNEREYAKKILTEKGNLGAIDMGYLGNFNHIFVIDGATGKWSGRPIGSSSEAPLEIELDYVNSEQYQVVKIFYRVNTSKFVGIYNSSIPSFQEIFKWELYNLSDNQAGGKPTGRIVEFVGEPTSKKSILIYEADVVGFDDQAFVNQMFTYEPKLKKSSQEPIHVFEYQLSEGKFGEMKKD